MKAFQDRQFNFPSKRLGLATTFLVSLSSVWSGLMMEMIKQSPATKDGVKKVNFNDGSGGTQVFPINGYFLTAFNYFVMSSQA